jgi:hypothetical protein
MLATARSNAMPTDRHILGLLAAFLLSPLVATAETPSAKVDFRRDVYPILKENCFRCHQGRRASAGLRLDQRVEILGETNGRPLVKPGDARQSRLWHVLTTADVKNRMPKDESPLSAAQIDVLRRWIEQDLPWNESLLPAADRDVDHWAFRPIRRPDVPTGRSPVDAFIAARQRAEGIEPAPEADRRTLIRRLSFDLLGLSPTPEEVERFAADSDPRAYEKLVDRLLASPQYGERWGRHWLDVARWAESEGYESNHLRLHAWRYRDWVIRSFNDDMPFADFVRRQIAGDELTPYRDDNLIATGFLAAARLSSNEEDRPRQRNDILVDIVNTTASAFLGVTLQCAQCHNHKFDPFTARDYYRLQGFFVQGQPGNVALADKELWAAYEARKAPGYDDAIREREELLALARKRKIAEARSKLSKEELHVYEGLTMAQRTPEQERLARAVDLKFQFGPGLLQSALEADEKKRFRDLGDKITEMEKGMLEEPQTFAFFSPATSPHGLRVLSMKGFYPLDFDAGFLKRNRAYLLAAGNVHQPSFPLDPGIPAMFDGVGQTKRRTRRDLADWLASPGNPLVPRVWVNRVWQQHFGRGLVATSADFGVKGSPPTHPELLDWLAAEFLASGGSTKHLHRLIANSLTYRQSHRGRPESIAKDPDNLTWSRWQPRRLEAEAVRDAMLTVSGDLASDVGGPSVAADEKQTRRSVYLFQKREAPPLPQALFDGPISMTEPCVLRNRTTTTLQALYLLNGEFSMARARSLALRIHESANDDTDRSIDVGFRIALQRAPNDRERELARRFFTSGTSESSLVLFSQTLLNLNEFLYLE